MTGLVVLFEPEADVDGGAFEALLDGIGGGGGLVVTLKRI